MIQHICYLYSSQENSEGSDNCWNKDVVDLLVSVIGVVLAIEDVRREERHSFSRVASCFAIFIKMQRSSFNAKDRKEEKDIAQIIG